MRITEPVTIIFFTKLKDYLTNKKQLENIVEQSKIIFFKLESNANFSKNTKEATT